MTSASRDKVITVDFLAALPSTEQQGFPPQEQQYDVLIIDRVRKRASFPWHDPSVRDDLAGLMSPNPDPALLGRLGKCLRAFLEGTNWSRAEEEIERRVQTHQPIDIVISSDSPEIYSLPWELLELRRMRAPLGSLDNCLIHYDWHEEPLHLPHPRGPGRILFAWSEASGAVPFQEHAQALEDACGKATCPVAPELLTLERASPRALKEALRDPERPVAVLHLLCHGTKTRSGAYGLALHGDHEGSVPARIDAAEFQQFFPAGTPPRLVVLSVCQSGDAGEPHVLGNLAQNLHRHGVPAVIASRMPLSCNGSVLFTKHLYEELLAGSGDLRQAFVEARNTLQVKDRSKDWVSLQLYARRRHEASFDPLCLRAPAETAPPQDELVVIRHEALDTISTKPEFPGRHIRASVHIDQTQQLKQRQWANLEAAVQELADPEGTLQRALAEPQAEFAYYGLPYVPLGALAGFLARRSRKVHVFEPDPATRRYVWSEAVGFPELQAEEQPGVARQGAVRLRLSITSEVALADCQRVLPNKRVRLDLHFKPPEPRPGLVRSEAQARAYVESVRATLQRHLSQDPGLTSLHVFASVPVSIAFLMGQEFSATWFPSCYVYNYGKHETPRYKWRLDLGAASQRKPSIKIF